MRNHPSKIVMEVATQKPVSPQNQVIGSTSLGPVPCVGSQINDPPRERLYGPRSLQYEREPILRTVIVVPILASIILPQSMDFQELSNFFGGTLFSEEYRGDFEQIKRDIEQRERSVHSKGSPNAKAEILLLKAVFELLRGEYTACQVNLDKIKAFGSEVDDMWRARCKIYERFNLVSIFAPSAIRFRSNLGGSASSIREAELRAVDEFSTQLPIPPSPTPLDYFEHTLASTLMTFIIAFWSSATFHPQFAHAGLKAAAARNEAMLSDIPSAGMSNMASLLGLDKVAAYLLRLNREIEASRNNPAPTTAF